MRKATCGSLLVAVVSLLVFSFQAFILFDQGYPYGTNSSFTIEQINTETKTDAQEIIQLAASESRANIFKDQPADTNSFYGRTLFAFVGDPDKYQQNYAEGYPNFSSASFATKISDQSEISTEDLRGSYYVSGDEQQVSAILETLNTNNIVAAPEDILMTEVLLLAIGKSHMAITLLVVFLASVLALVFSVVQHRKVYALKQIHGYSALSNYGVELRTLSASYLGIVTVSVLVLLAVLWKVNHLAQLVRFLTFLFAALVIFYLLLVICLIAAVALFDSVDVPRVLKGEKPVIRLGVFAAITQVVALVMCISSLVGSLDRIDAVKDSLSASRAWTEDSPLYVLRLSVTGTHEDDEAAAPLLTEIVNDFESKGKVLLSESKRVPETSNQYAYGGSRSLIVNNEYLSRQSIKASDGQIIPQISEEQDLFALLIPDSYSGDTDELVRSYQDELRSTCRIGLSESQVCDPKAVIYRTKSNQQLPTYGLTADLPVEYQRKAMIEDPVILVLTAKSQLIAPLDYLSYASKGTLLFEDYALLKQELDSAGILGAFQGIDNAADAVNQSVNLSKQETTVDRFNIFFAIVILFLCLLILAILYCERNKQIIFLRLIHGYRFIRRHASYMVVSAVLCAASATIAIAFHGSYSLRALSVAIGLACMSWILAIAVMRYYETFYKADCIKQG